MFDHKNLNEKCKEVLKKKKLIKDIHINNFRKVKSLLSNSNGITVEIGSLGKIIKEVIPDCLTTSQHLSEEIDRKENIYNLSFEKNSVDNLILMDIFHHLEFPALAIKEIERVLKSKGRVIIFDPAMGLIPRIIYKIFHHEPNGFNIKIDWTKIPNEIPRENVYFAAQSLSWRAFILKEMPINKNLKITKVELLSDFSFLASGGLFHRSLYPASLYNIIQKMDKFLTFIGKKIFAARMIIVLEKN